MYSKTPEDSTVPTRPVAYMEVVCDFVIEMGLIWNNTYSNCIVLNGKSTVIVLHLNRFHNTLLF